MKSGSYLLIAANSGRLLAQAARDLGYLPLVVDCFGDLDTGRAAENVYVVPGLDVPSIEGVIGRIKQQFPVSEVVYGAGFESRLESLRWLAEHFAINGNQPDVFANVTDKVQFFDYLQNENITFPETCFIKPPDTSGWLYKPSLSTGGAGIVLAIDEIQQDSQGYWQRYQPGQPHSVLFLANGSTAAVVGFNRQWTCTLGKQVFTFSGLMNITVLTAAQKQRLSNWINLITARFALSGLNSLDFIANDDGLFLLEVNARPPGSMQLYEQNLLRLHVAACRGKLPDEPIESSGIAAYQILYADKISRIPDTMVWPEGAMDLPQPGAVINTHHPICSIIARNSESEQVLLQLANLQAFILKQLR